ncbi:SDR family oxidoreductase [Comamonas thiooxydans]|uniref:SDR family oxidoreductase n=1 Tax=Comamonas thiooxydans TaxID=363952 RepID=A0AA42PYE7_9BURK|nr:SDR family oxidoreductase [Comamonas thiooxydans]MDH1333928.1 SDR family oxidoreductase [Comamonas thiooxydans]MDH1740150.1 SDR family oxidoreductase [Comamonas thiooxydans]MDH1786270.1 SDR family oxidoreductase [Comamonas thiooxydans]
MSYTLTGFEGKVAVVTGAGRMRSIGRPIALALAQAGCDVVLTGTGRAPDTYPEDERKAHWRDIESVADEIRQLGRRALPVVSDVSNPVSIDALLARTIAEWGRVDFLINNAGATRGDDRIPVTELSIDTWHRVMNVNLNGTFYMSRAFAKQMGAQGEGGVIINISSLAAQLLAPDTGAYATTKVAINGLTTIMARELGPKKIRVNVVAPGIVETSRLDDVPRGKVWDDMIAGYISLGRAGTGEDIAHLVAFLCSDQGEWITSQSIYVDGGHLPTPRRPT